MKIKIVLLLCFLYSCSKLECVKDAAPEMIGDWAHLSENDGFHYIYIQSNGRGHMYGKNSHGNNQDTQGRGWYVKDDVLYFSKFFNKAPEDKFTIDLYPTTSAVAISDSFNFIPAGTIYMKLNNRYYKKMR